MNQTVETFYIAYLTDVTMYAEVDEDLYWEAVMILNSEEFRNKMIEKLKKETNG